MAEALYGPTGFYRCENPAWHYRTSVHASPMFAAALARLAATVDEELGQPDPFDLVDVGAGRGELLAGIIAAVPAGLRARLRPVAVEVAARPAGLDAGIGWTREIPPTTGLLVANEWLDNIPVDVVELSRSGPRLVLVDPAGWECPGPPLGGADADWLATWWPLGQAGRRGAEHGTRAEIGRYRDAAWAGAVRQVRRGVAVAVDYAHDRATRLAGVHRAGTLTGYRGGRQVCPVPDGSCDLTAHVALDACAAAGTAAGATDTIRTTQRAALRALGLPLGRPPRELAAADPARYLLALAQASQASELADPAGLGGFGWLIQSVGVPTPLTVTVARERAPSTPGTPGTPSTRGS